MPETETNASTLEEDLLAEREQSDIEFLERTEQAEIREYGRASDWEPALTSWGEQ